MSSVRYHLNRTSLNKSKPLLLFCLLAFICFATFSHLWLGNNHAYIALQGWSAIDFSNWTLFAENFKYDYPGGARSVGNSLLPNIYPLLHSVLGVAPEKTLVLMTFLEILTLIYGSILLMKTLFPNVRAETFIVLAVILACSWARLPNLAKFAAPYFHGHFYGFADGLSLAAIAMHIKGKYNWSASILLLSFTIHPAITIFAGVFIIALQLIEIREIFKLKILLPYLAALFSALLWAILWIDVLGTNEGIPAKEYFKYVSLFNYHWFPDQLGIFTFHGRRYFLPFLASMLMFAATLARADLPDKIKTQISFAFYSLSILVLLGLAASLFHWSPELVKISFQRASLLMITISIIVILAQLSIDLANHEWWWPSLIITSFIAAFESRYTWPLSIALIYSTSYLLLNFKKQYKDHLFLLTTILLLSTLGYSLFLTHSNYLNNAAFMQWHNYTILFIKLSIILGAIKLLSKLNIKVYNFVLRFGVFTLICITIWSGVNWSKKYRALPLKGIASGNAYLETQLWAKNNTKSDALFMIDPCIQYGWRDFSIRSSFGGFQEWLKIGWIYTGDNEAFQEGIRRANLYPIDLKIDKGLYPGKASSEICNQARKLFYKPDGSFIRSIVKNNNIQFVVMSKEQAIKYGNIPAWPIAFQNELYAVLISPFKQVEQ